MPFDLSSLRDPRMLQMMQGMGQMGAPPMNGPPQDPRAQAMAMRDQMNQKRMATQGPPMGMPPQAQGEPPPMDAPNPMLENLQRKMMANRMQGAMGQPPPMPQMPPPEPPQGMPPQMGGAMGRPMGGPPPMGRGPMGMGPPGQMPRMGLGAPPPQRMGGPPPAAMGAPPMGGPPPGIGRNGPTAMRRKQQDY